MIDYLKKAYYAAKSALEKRKIHNKLLREYRSKKVILLFAGHHRANYNPLLGKIHSRDTGAVANGTTEHDECEKLVIEAHNILKHDGFNVLVCPFTYNLSEKVKWAEKFEKGCIVSVHLNSFFDSSANGTETWHHDNLSEAKKFHKVLVYHLGLRDRGVKHDSTNRHESLWIVNTKHVKVLIEVGFISNKNDLNIIRSKGGLALANACKGLFYSK